MVIVELDGRSRGQVERNVAAVKCCVKAVVLIPAIVERRLVLPVPRGYVERLLPHVVTSVVRQVRGRARRVPVTAAAQLALQVTGNGDRGWIRCVSRSVRCARLNDRRRS